MNARLIIIVIAAGVLSACVSAPQVPFDGASNANEKLRSDTYDMMAMLTSGQGCSSIEKVVTTVTEEPAGEPGHMKSSERWVAQGCGRDYPYEVTFTEDGSGGAYFSLKRL